MKKDTSRENLQWMRAKVHFGVIFICTAYLLTVLAQNIRFHELNRELLRLDRVEAGALEERARLSLAYEQHRNPARIRTIAVQKLGMVTPGPDRIHNLNPSVNMSRIPLEASNEYRDGTFSR